MNEQPLITIIIPIYNVEQYLERCVDSIIGQTYRNLQIILVDDGSPDRCGVMCDEYARNDGRIRVIHKKNGGQADARNAALSQIGGNYVSFIDGDDWVSPYFIEHLYKAIVANDADMAAGYYEEVFEPGRSSGPSREVTGYEILDAEQYLKRMFYQMDADTYVTVKLFRAEVIRDIRFPVGKLYEDVPVAYETATRCNSVAIVTNRDYYYWQRPNGTQNQEFNERKMDCITHFQDVLQSVEKDYPGLLTAARCRYLSAAFNILFQIHDNTHSEERIYLWNEIKKYRKGVILDSQARKKTRIASVLSYAGLPVVTAVYNRTQWRGQR